MNSTICINVADIKPGELNNTVDKILSIPPEELENYIYTRDKEKKLPIMEVKANQLPFVFTPALLKDEGVQERTNINYNDAMQNVKELSNHSAFADISKHIFEAYKRDMPFPDDVYGHIYKGFVSNMDKKTISRLSTDNYGDWEHIGANVSDERVPQLIERAVGNIDMELLSEEGKTSFESLMKDRYNDLSGKYGETLPKFWYEASEVKSSKEETKEVKAIIKELEEHVDYYASKYAPELLANKKEHVKEYGASIEKEMIEQEKDKKAKPENSPKP